MTVPLPSVRASVESIAPPSGRPFLDAAAGNGWVLAVDGGGVVVWSEETGYRQEPEHPPFVTRVSEAPGGFILFADDGGRYYFGFYSTSERRFAWWQPADSSWPELAGRSGRAFLFEDLVLLPAIGPAGHWVLLRAGPSGLERIAKVDAEACGSPTIFWRSPSSGEVFLGSGYAMLRFFPGGGGEIPPAREARRLEYAKALHTCRDGTAVLKALLDLPSGYSLVTGKLSLLPHAITLAREPWDAFLAGDRERVLRFVSLLAALEKGSEADPLLAVTFTAGGSPLAVLDRGICRVSGPDGDPPRATRPLFASDTLASWLYLATIDGGLEAALDALTRENAPHGLVDALISREGRAAFARLVRHARDRAPDDDEPPGRGVALLFERLRPHVSAEVVEALNDPDPSVAAIGCAALRSPYVDVGGELDAPSGKVYRRLANLLSSPAPRAARAALATLRERKFPISRRRIRALLCHEEAGVRQDACSLVCQGGPSPLAPDTHDALARLLRSETDAGLRSVLTWEIARGGRAPRLVALAAADVSSVVREQAFPAFGTLANPSDPGLCLSALDAVFLSAVTGSLRRRRSPSAASDTFAAVTGVAKLDGRLGISPELFEEGPVELLAIRLVAFAGRAVFGAAPEPWDLVEIEQASSLLSREPGLGGLSPRDLAWLEAPVLSAALLARFGEKVAPWPDVGARIDALAVTLSALEAVRGGLANAAPKGSLTARLWEAGVDRVRLDELAPDVVRSLATEAVLASDVPFPERCVAARSLAILGDPEPLRALWVERASRPHGLTALDRWRSDLDGRGGASATPGGPPAAH